MRHKEDAVFGGCALGFIFAWILILAFNVALWGTVIWAIIKLVKWLTGGGA